MYNIKRVGVGKGTPPFHAVVIVRCGHKHRTLSSAKCCGDRIARAMSEYHKVVGGGVFDKGSGCYADLTE